MYADNISLAMYSLLLKAPSAVPLCWKLVDFSTGKSQVYPFSTNIFLKSVHALLSTLELVRFTKKIVYTKSVGHSISSKLCKSKPAE